MSGMSIIVSHIKRFTFAFAGIIYALKTDKSYQFQLFFTIPAVVVFCFLFWPLTKIEILFLGLSCFLILITELQNTAFEAALDRLHPKLNEEIGHSKDMAAGSVLSAGFFLVFVMIAIVFF